MRRVAALCSAQRPAHASRRSPAPSAAAGSRVASQPRTRRSCQLTPRVAALCSALPAGSTKGTLAVETFQLLLDAPEWRVLSPSVSATHLASSRRSLVLSAAAGSCSASQPCARRSRWLMHRVAALCSAQPPARPSHRSPALGAAAGSSAWGSAQPPVRASRRSLCSARLRAHASRRSPAPSAGAGSCLASQP